MSRFGKLLITFSLTLFSACSESSITDLTNPVRPSASVIDDAGNKVDLIKGQFDSQQRMVSKVIGPAGGVLILSGDGKDRRAFHSVIVPAGAVQENLLFTMELSGDDFIIVDLNAYNLDAAGKPIGGTGHRGFAKPVYLTLSYAAAKVQLPKSRLGIVYLNDSTGRAERVNSRALPFVESVMGELRHFSRYAMCGN